MCRKYQAVSAILFALGLGLIISCFLESVIVRLAIGAVLAALGLLLPGVRKH